MSLKLKNKKLKKHTAAIRISNDIGLVSRKVWNVLLLNAYHDLKNKKHHEIPVSVLCDVINFDSRNYKRFREALEKLTSTSVSWDVGSKATANGSWSDDIVFSSLLAGGKIKNGILHYEYYSGLAEWLHEPAIYQTINISQQNLFTTSYSLALWENCIRFISIGTTGLSSVKEWRKLLGAKSKTYDQYKFFNSKVLQPAIKEINKVSNIKIKLKNKKKGRKIIQIGFDIEEEKQREILLGENLQELENSHEYKSLISYGIHKVRALKWLEKYGNDYIKKKIEFVKHQQEIGQIKVSVSGFLVRCIEENYKSDQELQGKREQKRKTLQLEIEYQEKQKKEVEYLEDKFIKQSKKSYLDSLSSQQRDKLLNDAKSEYQDNSAILNLIKTIDSPIIEGYIIKNIPNYEEKKLKFIKQNMS